MIIKRVNPILRSMSLIDLLVLLDDLFISSGRLSILEIKLSIEIYKKFILSANLFVTT